MSAIKMFLLLGSAHVAEAERPERVGVLGDILRADLISDPCCEATLKRHCYTWPARRRDAQIPRARVLRLKVPRVRSEPARSDLLHPILTLRITGIVPLRQHHIDCQHLRR